MRWLCAQNLTESPLAFSLAERVGGYEGELFNARSCGRQSAGSSGQGEVSRRLASVVTRRRVTRLSFLIGRSELLGYYFGCWVNGNDSNLWLPQMQ